MGTATMAVDVPACPDAAVKVAQQTRKAAERWKQSVWNYCLRTRISPTSAVVQPSICAFPRLLRDLKQQRQDRLAHPAMVAVPIKLHKGNLLVEARVNASQ